MKTRVSDNGPPSDPQQWVFANWHLVERLARRRFSDQILVEEAGNYVMEKLSADNWRSLRSFQGKARFATFFCSVVYRLLEDFSRHRFGRVRPPAWLRRLGGVWTHLFRLLCLQRYPLHEAVMLAEAKYHQLHGERKLEKIAEKIRGDIPDCGKRQFAQQSFDEEHHNIDINGDENPTPHGRLEYRQRHTMLAAISVELWGSEDQRLQEELAVVGALPLRLAPRERLLLQLHHRDNLSVAEAGRMIGLNRFQAHGLLRRLYAKIRRELAEAGRTEEFRQLLED